MKFYFDVLAVLLVVCTVCAAYPDKQEAAVQQFGLHSSQLYPPARRAHEPAANKPNPMQRILSSMPLCVDQCLVACQPMDNDKGETMYVCPRLKPVEKSLHERFIAQASLPWLVFLVVLGICLLFCCGCVCWSCCCREGCQLASSGRGRDSNSSREPLAADRRIEEIMGEHPSASSSSKRGISGSKYVVDV